MCLLFSVYVVSICFINNSSFLLNFKYILSIEAFICESIYYIYNILMNERQVSDTNPLYEIANTSRTPLHAS